MIAAYQRINTISETSDSQSSCSDNSINERMPKMLDDFKVKQAHSEMVEKLLDKYLQDKHSSKDLMLMHAVCSNKELISPQFKQMKADEDHLGDFDKNSIYPKVKPQFVSKSLSKMNISTLKLIDGHEESKFVSLESPIDLLKQREETKQDLVESFNESNLKND